MEMENHSNLSANQHSRQNLGQVAGSDLQTRRLQFLERIGLKSECELWSGKKLNPDVIEKAYQRLHSPRGYSMSRTRVNKAMRDALKELELVPD